jgi:hypothetical protein
MFILDKEQLIKLAEWRQIQDQQAVCIQKESVSKDDPFYNTYQLCWEDGYPYGGATGGGLTYSFTHTPIGTVVKVKNNFTNQEIDLTDYQNW